MLHAAATSVFRRREGRGPAARGGGAKGGFTISEALATVLIVGLVSIILAGGIALATRHYTQSMSASEGRMLYSSLQQILETELSYTSTYTYSSRSAENVDSVTGFSSRHYKAKSEDASSGSVTPIATENLCTLLEGDAGVTIQSVGTPGRLAMCSADGKVTNPFLGAGAYNYGLQASISQITYNTATGFFTVRLVISQGSGGDAAVVVDEPFSVRGMNSPKGEYSAIVVGGSGGA